MYFLLDICRLCLSHKNEFYDLSNDDIMEKLVTCISDLEFEDHIPSVICEECLEQVDLYYEFRNKCLRSEFIINNYVEKLRGGVNSHLRSKLQVKLAKNFSSSKFSSNVKLPHSTLPIANSSKDTDVNKDILEDLSFDEVHTDITERVKLRKRFPVKRLQSITPEKRSPSVNSSRVTENARQNLSLRLHRSSITSEESNGSVVNSTIPDAFERVFFDPSNFQCPPTSIQSKSCPLEVPVNPNHDITESSFGSINFKQNQQDNSNHTKQKDCDSQTSIQCKDYHLQAPINPNHDLTESSSGSVHVKQKQSDTNSNQDVAQQEGCEELIVNLYQNHIYSEEVPGNSNRNVLTDNIGDIVVDNEEPSIISEIKVESGDPPDEINRMLLLESLVKQKHSGSDSRTPIVNTSMQLKRKEYTMRNYVEQKANKHISSVEHNYAGQIYLPSRKKLKNQRDPSTDSSSNSDENDVDVERITENEKPVYIDGNVLKCLKERNRRSRLRTYLEDLVCALPSNIEPERRTQITVLNESKYYIWALEKEVCQNSNIVAALKEKNLQLRDRLKEITLIKTKDS